MTTRRRFVEQAGTALGAFALSPSLTAVRLSLSEPARAPLRILILGGTGFIGPHQVRYAVSRGHHVTVFNRGRRQADLPDGVEHLQGDRETGALDALRGQRWDAVIDNPTTLPYWVRDVGQVLKDATNHYVFVSTISVYPHYRTAGMDENYPLATYESAEPALSLKRSTPQLYGPLKVQSEREAERWFPNKTTVVRPGLIVGPGDETDRFSYWPVRIDRGGEILAPGTGSDPVQIIDARDLAEFIIRLVEQRTVGTFNATGPRESLNMSGMLTALKAALGRTDARLTWADASFLAANNVRPWSDMPTWAPVGPENAGWGRVSIARALSAGLTFRPFDLTARDTLAWFKSQSVERQKTLKAGITPEREAELLALWHTRTKP